MPAAFCRRGACREKLKIPKNTKIRKVYAKKITAVCRTQTAVIVNVHKRYI